MKQFNIDYLEEPLDMGLLEPYKDLLYCRLDMPEVPSVDRVKLEHFINETHETIVKKYLDIGSSDRFSTNANVPYPWKTAWIKGRLHKGWVNEFDKKFPELTDYLLNFPIDSFDDIAVAQFLAQKENQEAFPHTDPDPFFGFRIYISDETDRADLYFYKSHEALEVRPQTYVMRNGVTVKNDLQQFYDYNQKIVAKNNKGKFPFMINSVRCAHGIAKHEKKECDRVVLCPFFRRINSAKLKALFDRSIETYPEEVIWRK